MKKTVQLITYNNDHFNPGAGRLKRACWHIVNAVFFKSFFHFYGLKVFLLKIFGAEIGINVIIKPSVNIKYPWNLIIGNNVWIGEEVWIDNLVTVQIGNNVCISQGALLLCGNHNFSKSSFDLITGTIILEDGVWIGAKSIVGPNVICHSHSVLSVNSAASKDLQAYGIYRGNPAQLIKERIIE
jgi:putative colanic acid biosynthesis acetyltransferase WcaF